MFSESIYNLIPPEVHVPEKQPRYQSTFSKNNRDGTLSLTGSTLGTFGTSRIPGAGRSERKEGATFGPLNLNNQNDSVPNPKHFLRKGEGTLRRSGRQALDATSSAGRSQRNAGERINRTTKPPLPRREDEPIFGIKSSKDFVTANAVEAILSVPSYQREEEVNYLKKEDYGKVPSYLESVKEEVRRENEMIEEYVREQLGGGKEGDEGPRYEHFPQEEREALLAQLRRKREEINQKYQKQTHVVNLDSVGQVRRKKQLEAKLDELDRDIELLEREGDIYIPLDV
jgi:hypothetical protein